MPKGPSLRACSLLYNMMATTKSLFLQELSSHYKMAPDNLLNAIESKNEALK